MPDAPRFDVSTAADAELVVVPVSKGGKPGPGAAEAGRALGVDLAAVLKRHGVTGDRGQTLMVPAASTTVMLVGVEGEGPNAVREAAMRAGAAARPFATVASTLPQIGGDALAAAQAFSEGFLIGAYRDDGLKTAPQAIRTKTVRAVVASAAVAATRKGLKRGEITGRAVNHARTLTNAPAADATPAAVAEEARRSARRLGLTCKVWTKAALEKGGFGGILAVGRGSVNEPRMVELSYAGGRGKPIAVTGKGITFDSGGLDLKRPSEMAWMRSDKAGAAAALATIEAVAELGVKANVIAVLPLAENLPGGDATRPGDIVRHRGGKTSEVIDTDAEGRVLLADALAYLAERTPRVIIDSATLTDASGMGADLFACMGTDRALTAEMVAAGEEAGEPGWEIPLWSRYRPLIDSPVADVKNLGDHDVDSSMMAGLFLRDFVGDVSWVHIDSGSSAWAEYPTDLWTGGAKGVPVRAFVRFIERLAG